MSTKQAVILAFMLVFLAASLACLGIWLNNATELSIKKKAIEALQEERSELETKRKKIDQGMKHPTEGLDVILRTAQDDADAKFKAVYQDTDDGSKKRYEAQLPKIKALWGDEGGDAGEAAKVWKTVYEEWTKENNKIKTEIDSLNKQVADSDKSVETATAETETEKKNLETQRKDLNVKIKSAEDQLYAVRLDGEVVQDKINKVSREFEKSPEQEKDGEVVFSDPAFNTVVVDIGFEHGARSGMLFFVYSGRHSVPVLKSQLKLTDVRATSSDAILVPVVERKLYDPQSHWEAPDSKFRFSPYATSGPDGTDPQPLEVKKTKKEQVDELRFEKIKQQMGQEEADLYFQSQLAPPKPPLINGKGFEPVVAGDWLGSTEFTRIIKEKEFNQKVTEELLSLTDINTGSLTFYFTDMIRPFRKDFLARLCERNRCRVTPVMTPDVDYIVSAADATRIDQMEIRKDVAKEDAATPDAAKRKSTLGALKEGQKYGAKVITMDELETFFIKRQRKSELAKGKVIQPGQHTFFVVGETQLRSVRETNLYLKELGGVVLDRMDAGVDYVVVGAGLVDAKLDMGTGRVYYPGQTTPADAKPFYEAVRSLGLKVLREEELPKFFGRE